MNLIRKLKKYMGLYFIIALFFCIYFMSLEGIYENAFKYKENKYLIKIVSLRNAGNYTDKYIGKILTRQR